MFFYYFFFSSRRRHTRYIGDWSSDVCSSDLCEAEHQPSRTSGELKAHLASDGQFTPFVKTPSIDILTPRTRSEERRVGKECRSRWKAYDKKKKKKIRIYSPEDIKRKNKRVER